MANALILDDARLEDDRSVIVVLHEFLHLGGQVGNVIAADSFDVHRFGKLDEVRVGHGGMRVALLVEEICAHHLETNLARGGREAHPAIEAPFLGTHC